MAHLHTKVTKGMGLPFRLVPARPIPESPEMHQNLQMLVNVNGVFHLTRFPVGYLVGTDHGQLIVEEVTTLQINGQSILLAKLIAGRASYLIIKLPSASAGMELAASDGYSNIVYSDGLMAFKAECDLIIREALKPLWP